MYVLDLFSGTGGWSEAFKQGGEDVFRIDYDKQFEADAYLDIGETSQVLDVVPWTPDVILASPPCNSFSRMSMGKMWEYGKTPIPKHPNAQEGMRLVLATVRLIALYAPRWFAIENPRGRLQTLDLLDGFERTEIWQCRFGKKVAKPTTIWTNVPVDWTGRKCHNGNGDHIAAPAGSRTGTQGMDKISSAAIPFQLSELVYNTIKHS